MTENILRHLRSLERLSTPLQKATSKAKIFQEEDYNISEQEKEVEALFMFIWLPERGFLPL